MARGRLVCALGGQGRARRRGPHHRHPAAQRHGHAAHGSRARRHHPRRLYPLLTHAWVFDALDFGHRSRGHRHPDQGRQKAQVRGHLAARDRPRSLRRGVPQVARGIRRGHRRANQAHGMLRRFFRREIHHEPRLRAGRAARLLSVVPRRIGVSRQAHRELVPELRHRHQRRRGRIRKRGLAPVVSALSAERANRRARPRRRGHDAPGDHARRQRRGRGRRRFG